MGFSKGQSGTEYLSNYAVVSVVILIVIGALSYMGIWNILFPDQLPICIFQKGLDCDSYYIQHGNPVVKMTLYNRFEDAIVISDIICSAVSVNPSTALPEGRSWGDAPPGERPTINGNEIYPSNPNLPVIFANEPFDVEVKCFAKDGSTIASLDRQDRYTGLVFVKYRLNSSPQIAGAFEHTLQGNLQGKPQ